MENKNVSVVEVPTQTEGTETVRTLKMPAVRAMTRKQFKQMRAAGFDPLSADREEQAGNTVEMFDWILENVYGDYDFDDYPNGECMRLAADTFRLAIGEPTEEAKNS